MKKTRRHFALITHACTHISQVEQQLMREFLEAFSHLGFVHAC